MVSQPSQPVAGALTTRGRKRRPVDRRRISEMLTDLSEHHPAPRISIADIRDAFGSRAHGALLFMFALINFIPVPPGGGFVLALPVVLVAAELLFGAERSYLPRWLAKRSFRIEDFRSVVKRLSPLLQRVERLLRPRLVWLTSGLGKHAVGLVCFALALVLFMPVPVAGNWPPSFAICLIALALIQRDGLVVLLGLVSAVVSFWLAWATIVGAVHVVAGFITRFFG